MVNFDKVFKDLKATADVVLKNGKVFLDQTAKDLNKLSSDTDTKDILKKAKKLKEDSLKTMSDAVKKAKSAVNSKELKDLTQNAQEKITTVGKTIKETFDKMEKTVESEIKKVQSKVKAEQKVEKKQPSKTATSKKTATPAKKVTKKVK